MSTKEKCPGIAMHWTFPELNLKAKLIALMVLLLGLTLGAEVYVSVRAQTSLIRAFSKWNLRRPRPRALFVAPTATSSLTSR